MLDPITRAENARRNGALSKGPTSPEGKARSSQNAITHGLTAEEAVVLNNENPEAWLRHLDQHLTRYRPQDEIETELVEDIAFCRWRLLRFRGVDTALWNLQMDEQSEEFAQRYKNSHELARLAFAFRNDNNIVLASRYEGRLRRAYDRSIRTFKEHRANQPVHIEKNQNEPTLD
jgi:hypothetical protein